MNYRWLNKLKAQRFEAVTAELNQASAADVKRMLEQFPLAVQDRVMRRALWSYNAKIAKAAKAARPVRTGRLKKSTSVKIKRYKWSMWGAVAARTGLPKDGVIPASGKARRVVYDVNAGWREHFTELGWHSWSKSWPKPGKGSGKDWKKKRYHRGRGNYHRGSMALITAAQVFQPRLRQHLNEALRDAVVKYTTRKFTSPRTIFARI
ncbi:MAG: hypothetical protein RI990_127 [Planctomycetota bacterium]|jgi:hypothetical protein